MNSLASLSRELVRDRRGRSLVSIYRINAHSGTRTTAQLASDSATMHNVAHHGASWVSLPGSTRGAALSRQSLDVITTLTLNGLDTSSEPRINIGLMRAIRMTIGRQFRIKGVMQQRGSAQPTGWIGSVRDGQAKLSS